MNVSENLCSSLFRFVSLGLTFPLHFSNRQVFFLLPPFSYTETNGPVGPLINVTFDFRVSHSLIGMDTKVDCDAHAIQIGTFLLPLLKKTVVSSLLSYLSSTRPWFGPFPCLCFLLLTWRLLCLYMEHQSFLSFLAPLSDSHFEKLYE